MIGQIHRILLTKIRPKIRRHQHPNTQIPLHFSNNLDRVSGNEMTVLLFTHPTTISPVFHPHVSRSYVPCGEMETETYPVQMDIDLAARIHDGRLAAQLEDFADQSDGLRGEVAEVGRG